MSLTLNKCEKCNGVIKKRKNESKNAYLKKKFCGRKCFESSPRPARKTGENKKCATCDNEIYVAKSAIKERNFCSASCHDAYQGRNKTIHNCKICGNEFRWSPSRVLDNNPTYCSIECRNKCEDWKLNAVIKGNLIQQNRKSPSSLEVVGYGILDDLAVNYSKQVLIANKFTVDAKINDSMIVIQFDGDYWHGYMEEGHEYDLDHRQKKRVNLDKSQDAYMKKIGYTVLRYWEHDVHRNKEFVVENIRSAIQKIAN